VRAAGQQLDFDRERSTAAAVAAAQPPPVLLLVLPPPRQKRSRLVAQLLCRDRHDG